MGNKQKVGSKGRCYKKKFVIRRQHNITNETIDNISTPISIGYGEPSTSAASSTPIVASEVGLLVEEHKDSSRKCKVKDNEYYYAQHKQSLVYDILDIHKLFETIKDLAVCRHCKHSLSFERNVLVGLAVKLKIFCTNCNENITYENCSNTVDNSNGRKTTFYDLNLRLVNGLRSIGKGQTAGKIICGMLNIPAPPTKYRKHEEKLCRAIEELSRDSMKKAVKEVVTMNKSSDLCVAVDGSWQKRGHMSLNGVLSVTSVDTGKVIDVSIMSKFCVCPGKNENIHKENCSANYRGTSGGMEVCGAVEVFSRSQQMYGVRYLEYLGDGDSKGFTAVNEKKIYGEQVEISKLECIGHVEKRMGTRLLNMKSQKKELKDGKTLSGKNRLTAVAIKKLQKFYGLAIRRNCHSVAATREAIWAIYFHVSSNNENASHMHRLCPNGESSWCKYNKSLITKEPYDHGKHFHLPQIVMEEIKSIFRDLSDSKLLEKCCKGKTQNPNESFNNTIWSIIPKRVFVTLPILKYGVYSAVCSFNDGFKSKVQIMEKLGFWPGTNLVKAMMALEVSRLNEAEKKSQDLQKKIRYSRALKRKRLEDQLEEEEDPDNPSYSAGHY